MQKKSSIVLGIDPGTNVMGYALLKTQGNVCTVLKMDVLKMSSEKDIYKRLEKIHSTIV
jgi:crossover junction endodeoxyribonuclease RuvC